MRDDGLTLAQLQRLCRDVMHTADKYGVLITSIHLTSDQWAALDKETKAENHPQHALVRTRKFKIFRVNIC
jgi:hypothetical protein